MTTADVARQTLGSPAGAGIDPALSNTGNVVTGFPRRRGDRPIEDLIAEAIEVVPPQARG